MAAGNEPLLRGPTPDMEAEREAERSAEEKARVIVIDGLVVAYARGELTLRKLCEYAVQATRPLKKFHMLGAARQKLLGAMIERAVTTPQRKRTRGNRGEPTWFREVSMGLLEIVLEREGGHVNRGSRNSAVARVVEIWRDCGFRFSEHQIERWCYPPTRRTHRKKSNRRGKKSNRRVHARR